MRLYECGVRFDKMMENGLVKKVTEIYLVDAITFSEAEARIVKEITPYMSGDFDVVTIKRTKYSEIVYDKFNIASAADGEVQKMMGRNSQASVVADKWFKVKINLITIDEKTAAEKKSAVYYIVNAGSNAAAHETVVSFLKGTLSDYEIASVVETNIMDVYVYYADGTKSIGVKEANSKQTVESIFEAHDKHIQAMVEKVAADSKVQKAVKRFRDAVPDGTKVTISHSDPDGRMSPEVVVVDKSKPNDNA